MNKFEMVLKNLPNIKKIYTKVKVGGVELKVEINKTDFKSLLKQKIGEGYQAEDFDMSYDTFDMNLYVDWHKA